jgi:hypothetical protein
MECNFNFSRIHDAAFSRNIGGIPLASLESAMVRSEVLCPSTIKSSRNQVSATTNVLRIFKDDVNTLTSRQLIEERIHKYQILSAFIFATSSETCLDVTNDDDTTGNRDSIHVQQGQMLDLRLKLQFE